MAAQHRYLMPQRENLDQQRPVTTDQQPQPANQADHSQVQQPHDDTGDHRREFRTSSSRRVRRVLARYRTRDEAENAIFTYIDGWYNTRRIQKELGYLSPDEYETTWRTHQTQPAEPPITTPAPAGGR